MKYYSYVSTRADYDPCKTLIVFAPSRSAVNLHAAEEFAVSSGWRTAAEEDGAVLIIPIAENGWSDESCSLPCDIYDECRNSFFSKNGRSIAGRGGKLWCWETLVYWVGYDDGANFAGQCAVAHPNRFSACALIDGAATEYADGDLPSDHWLVKNVSSDYSVLNKDIPVCIWLISTNNYEKIRMAKEYYDKVNGSSDVAELRISEDKPKNLCEAVMDYFNHVIRWKNSPDGTLARIQGHEDFYNSGYFEMTEVTVNNISYPCAVHIPEGKTAEEAEGLPLLFSVHGRGEPCWLFASKNGYDTLADFSGEYVLAVPDSPGNLWLFDRDRDAFPALIDHLCNKYKLDRTRVFMTGFSNGASITREVSTWKPELFAGIAPFNGPTAEAAPGVVKFNVHPDFESKGFQLPAFITVGDNDGACTPEHIASVIETFKRVNRSSAYALHPDVGERFNSTVYYGDDDNPYVVYNVMKNMPHGAIPEEAIACWSFLRHYSRPEGSKTVKYD